MNIHRKLCITLVFLLACISVQATMMIYPKYISFDDNSRVAEMTLINPSEEETINYRIRLKYFTQNHNGSYDEVTHPDGLTGINLLRHSPKAVTLGPKKAQTIKILKRLPDGIAAGEYTAYIVFTKVLAEKPLEKPKKSSSDKLEIQLIPIPSFAIPINIAVGKRPQESAKVFFLGTSGENNQLIAHLRLARIDTDKKPLSRTVRGDLSIWQDDKILGVMKGKYLLAGNDYVDVDIPLSTAEKGKKATILFTKYNENDPVLTDEAIASENVVL